MNRPIKFRIWDKIGEVFRGNLNKFLINAHTGELEVWAFSDLYDEWYNTHESDDNLVIQQFTGLLDKNGREIYEGDIVEFYQGYPNQNDCSFYKSVSEVEYKDGTFWPRPMIEYNEDDTWFNYELKDLKIIGNKFENPELLKTV